MSNEVEAELALYKVKAERAENQVVQLGQTVRIINSQLDCAKMFVNELTDANIHLRASSVLLQQDINNKDREIASLKSQLDVTRKELVEAVSKLPKPEEKIVKMKKKVSNLS